MGLEALSRTLGARGDLAVGGQGIHPDAEPPGSPRAHERGAVQLSLADGLGVEVALAQHQEMAGRVVVGGGVSGDRGVAKREIPDVMASMDEGQVIYTDPDRDAR